MPALARQGEDAPVVRLVNVVLMSAIQKGASDIHIEPYEKELRVRYRIDGILYNIMRSADEVPRCDLVAHQDHVEARHRGEAPAPGRPASRFASTRTGKQRNRLPRLGAADALRREDRHASARPRQVDARHDEARVRNRVASQVRGSHSASVGHGARHRSDRRRQDQHALFVDGEINTPETNIRPPRIRSNSTSPASTRCRSASNIGLNFAAALRFVPAPGPEHHPRRRNPRLRNGGNRREGGAHRPPGALHAAHQRRAEHHQSPS